MKTLSKSDVEAIVQREMPGFRVAAAAEWELDSPPVRQMRSPGLAAIQEKLRDRIRPYTTPESVMVTDAAGQDVVESVLVEPKGNAPSQEKKTILISSAKRTIIGSQG